MRIFLLFLLVSILWLAIRWVRRFLSAPKNSKDLTEMVRCETCALHIPRNEAICDYDKDRHLPHYFCSEEHRNKKAS